MRIKGGYNKPRHVADSQPLIHLFTRWPSDLEHVVANAKSAPGIGGAQSGKTKRKRAR